MTELIHLHYDRPGKSVTRFDEWLVLDRGDAKVLLLERFDDDDVVVNGKIILASGAPVIWYVFPETWHDVGRFHDGDGNLTGWYTNVCTPMEMNGTDWRTRDLFLDLWQPVNGEPVWLDEDELKTAVRSKIIDNHTHKRIKNERALIDMRVKMGSWPPPIVRDIDLEQARSLRS